MLKGVISITKKGKLIDKIRNNPKTVKFDDIDKMLLDIGFERRQPSGGSSHYTYVFGDKILTVPFKKPYVKVIYVKMAIKLLDDLGY